jgi:RNA polymerase sigma factor (sigma-70 family)
MANAIAIGAFNSDQDLVESIRRGDRSAVGYFFNKFSPLIYSHICKRVDRQDIDDAYQEFFVYISKNTFSAICAWDGRCQLTTWIYTVLRNFISGFLRKYKRNPPTEPLGEDISDPDGPSLDPPTGIMVEEMKQTIKDAMNHLSDRDKNLINRRHLLDQSPREIAESLGTSLNAYYQAQFRAEKRFAKIFKEHYPEIFEYLV